MSDSPTPEAQPTNPAGSAAPADPAAPAAAPVAVADPAVPPDETPVAAGSDVPTDPAVPAAAPVTAAAPATRRKTVEVPKWALAAIAAVAALVLVVGAFFIGRSTAPDSGSAGGPKTLADAVEMTASGDMEVGDFDARALIQALSQNENLDLGVIGDLLLGDGARR